MTDLVLATARNASQPVNLVFGDTGAAIPSVMVDVAATFNSFQATVTAAYDIRVSYYLSSSKSAPYQTAAGHDTPVATGWDISNGMAPTVATPLVDAVMLRPTTGALSHIAHGHATGARNGWDVATPIQRDASAVSETSIANSANSAPHWSRATGADATSASRMQAAVQHSITRIDHSQLAQSIRNWVSSLAGASRNYIDVSMPATWQVGGAAVAGRMGDLPVIVVPVPMGGQVDLVFECPPLLFPYLVFGGASPCDASPLIPTPFFILPARFYMTTHTVYAQRLPDLAEVPIFEATVSADAGSYCWSLSASGPSSLFSQLAAVGGLPVQLRVTMDGIPFVFAVDALSRSTGFGKTSVNISGRSVTALIGAPYLRVTARSNTGSSRLAQQLAGDALQTTGVDLDWGLTDWLVPAGAWSHQGTPLDAVQAIAQAAGGYLQSHRSAATLLTRHPYGQRTGDNPGAPWGWMTGPADVELAPDAIITDGTERKDGSDINAVYVSGTTHGVLGLVKRTGSAADKLAAMVTDPLITHVDAARQRGLSILGAAGSKYFVRLELPVLTGLAQPGVLDVGQLVQVNAAQPWRGRVRSVSVNAKRPSLRQTITLECHLEAV